MSITSQSRRNNYTGTNALSVYDYTFKLFAAADVQVKVRKLSDGTETTLVLNTDYSVQFVNQSTGGTITLLNAGQAWLNGSGYLLSTYAIAIRLYPALSQSTDIKNNTRYFPYLHERQFDKEFQILLKQQDELDRAVKLPSSIDPAEFDTNLPKDILVNGPGKFIKVNTGGTGLELGDSSVDLSNKEDRTLEVQTTTDFATPIELTNASPKIPRVSSASLVSSSYTSIPINYSLLALTVSSAEKINLTTGTPAAPDYSITAADGITQLDNTYPSGSVIAITGVVDSAGSPSYQDVSAPDVTTIPLGWSAIIRDLTTGTPVDYNGIYTNPGYGDTLSYDTSVKETKRIRNKSIVDNTAAGWVVGLYEVKLPSVATLTLNKTFSFKNNTDGDVSVYSYGDYANVIILKTLAPGQSASFKCVSISNNLSAGWQVIDEFKVRLPSVTTLNKGRAFIIDNTSNVEVNVFSYSGYPSASLFTVVPRTRRSFMCVSISDNSDAGWEVLDIDAILKEDVRALHKTVVTADEYALTNASEKTFIYGGAFSYATVTLPDVAALQVGRSFVFDNRGTDLTNGISVNSFDNEEVIYLESGCRYKVTCKSNTDNAVTGWELERMEQPGRILYQTVNLSSADVILDNTCSEYIQASVSTPNTYYMWLPKPDSMNGRHIIISHYRGGGGVNLNAPTLWIKDHNGSAIFFPPDGLAEGASVLALPGANNQWQFFSIGNPATYVGGDAQKIVVGSLGVTEELYCRGDIVGLNDITATDDLIVGDAAFIGGSLDMSANPAKTWPGAITWQNARVVHSTGNQIDYFHYEALYTASIVGLTAAGVGTYNNRSIEYIRLSFVIFFTIHLDWSAHTGTGNMKVSGLPANANIGIFNCKYAVTVANSNIALTAGYILQAEIDSATSDITLTQVPVGGGAAIAVPIDAAGKLTLTGWYHTFGA